MHEMSVLNQNKSGFINNVKKMGVNASPSGESREVKASFKEYLSSDVTETRTLSDTDKTAGGASIVKNMISKEDLYERKGLGDSKSRIQGRRSNIKEVKGLRTVKDGAKIDEKKDAVSLIDKDLKASGLIKEKPLLKKKVEVEDGGDGIVFVQFKNLVVQNEKNALPETVSLVVNGDNTNRLGKSHVEKSAKSTLSGMVRTRLSVDSDNGMDQKAFMIARKLLVQIKEGKISGSEFAVKVSEEIAKQGEGNATGISTRMLERLFRGLNNGVKGEELVNNAKSVEVNKVIKAIDDLGLKKEALLVSGKVSNEGRMLDQNFAAIDKLKANSDARNSARNSELESRNSLNHTDDSRSESDLSINKLVTSDEMKSDVENGGRSTRGEQKIVLDQSAKNELFGQNQKKSELVYQSMLKKSKEGKGDLTDAGSISGNEKSFMSAKVQAVKSPANIQNNVNPDLKSQFGEMVVSGAKQFIKGGSQEIHLTIRKPDLGNLKISFIERGKGGLDISIVTERVDAVEVIKQNSGELKQLLLQDGIDLSKFDVFSENSRDRGRLLHNDGNQQRQQKRQHLEEEALSNLYDKEVEPYTLEVQNSGLVTGNSQINVFA